MRFLTPTLTTCALLAANSALYGDAIEITRSGPDLDRWMYPFNGTPGTRPAASTFGNWDQYDGLFDNRDAQLIIGFDTASDLPPESATDYRVTSAIVTIQLSNEGIVFDGTVDPYQVYLSEEDSERLDDEDAGQPIELFGIGYRDGFDSATWVEDSVFTTGADIMPPGVRTAYAVAYQEGEATDISNHVREAWTPQPFAVASIDGVTAGQIIPIDSVFRFEVDVDNQNIQDYLISNLSEGTLRLVVSSMTRVEVQGGIFPLFYCKENVSVDFGLASAATLELTLEPASQDPCSSSDINGDGTVNGADLTLLLADWGTSGTNTDLDGDGHVSGADLTLLLGCWS